MNRRTFVKTAGGAAVGLSLAGCLGGNQNKNKTKTTTKTTAKQMEQKWTDVTTTVSEEKLGPKVEIPYVKPFRLPKEFGVLFDIKNTTEKTLADVKVRFELLGKNSKVLKTIEKTISGSKRAVDKLAADAVWSGRTVFQDIEEGTRKTINKIRVWATGKTKQTGTKQSSSWQSPHSIAPSNGIGWNTNSGQSHGRNTDRRTGSNSASESLGAMRPARTRRRDDLIRRRALAETTVRVRVG